MWHHLTYMIERFNSPPPGAGEAGREHYPVAIRRARDSDVPLLHELAALDSAAPLAGPVLVAVVEGRIWAAMALDDDRVIADPFLPTAPAVQLLALRGAQLREGDRRARRVPLSGWIAGRARA